MPDVIRPNSVTVGGDPLFCKICQAFSIDLPGTVALSRHKSSDVMSGPVGLSLQSGHHCASIRDSASSLIQKHSWMDQTAHHVLFDRVDRNYVEMTVLALALFQKDNCSFAAGAKQDPACPRGSAKRCGLFVTL